MGGGVGTYCKQSNSIKCFHKSGLMTFPKIKYIRPEHLLCQGPVVGRKGSRNDSPDAALWRSKDGTGTAGRIWAEPLVRAEGCFLPPVCCVALDRQEVQRKDSQQGFLKQPGDIWKAGETAV